jgi:hypothetical protein
VAPLRLGGLRGKESTPSVWLGGTGESSTVGKQEHLGTRIHAVTASGGGFNFPVVPWWHSPLLATQVKSRPVYYVMTGHLLCALAYYLDPLLSRNLPGSIRLGYAFSVHSKLPVNCLLRP